MKLFVMAVVVCGVSVGPLSASGGDGSPASPVNAVRAPKHFAAIGSAERLDSDTPYTGYRRRGPARSPFRSDTSTTLGPTEQKCSVVDTSIHWCSVSTGHTVKCSVIGGPEGESHCSVKSGTGSDDPTLTGDCSVKDSADGASGYCSTISPPCITQTRSAMRRTMDSSS